MQGAFQGLSLGVPDGRAAAVRGWNGNVRCPQGNRMLCRVADGDGGQPAFAKKKKLLY
jgi:hypothetical protein